MKLYIACFFMWISMETSGQALSKNHSLNFLALGDSYTIGESVPKNQRWPEQLVNALRKKGYSCMQPDIIAATGWRTDDLKNACEALGLSKNYNLVSLLIGVNNQYQGKSTTGYATEFKALLAMAVTYAGGKKSNVIVLSIPDYGYTPFGIAKQPGVSAEIDAFNIINRSITEKKGMKYIDITDISRRGLKDPELVAGDGLHPSGKMYALWVERILDHILGD